MKPTNHHSQRSTTPNQPPSTCKLTPNPPPLKPMNHPNHQSSKTQANMLFYKNLRQRRHGWKKDGSDEWKRGQRWSRWEITFIGRNACKHDGEAMGWGLGCGEIGVGLVGFIRDRFEHDREVEAARSDQRWVWAMRSDQQGRGSRTRFGLHRRQLSPSFGLGLAWVMRVSEERNFLRMEMV